MSLPVSVLPRTRPANTVLIPITNASISPQGLPARRRMMLSMRTKLMGILALSVMATIVVGWLGIAGMRNLNAALNGLYANDFEPARVIAEADIAIMTWNRDMLNYLLARDPEARDGYRRAVFEQKKVILARLQLLSIMEGLTTEEKLLVATIADHFRQAESRWNPEIAPVTVEEQSGAELSEALLVELKPLVQQVNEEMSTFLRMQEVDSLAAQTTADRRFHTDIKNISLLIGLIILFLVAVNLFMARSFIRSIGELTQGARELGQGNLEYRVRVRAKDELSQLASVFNIMAGEVKEHRDALQRAHDELELRVEERTLELGRINEELRKEVAERMRIEEALRESSEKLKFFAYSVMHDLKSPAIGVHGIANLLHRNYQGALDERGRSYCEQILRASKHIATFVDSINTFIASKENPLAIETLNLGQILEPVREEVDNDLCLRRVAWRVSASCSVEIEADKLSMIRVFRNLVANALKYGGERLGEISIGYEQTSDFHIFSVSDNGVGIKREDCERIFAVFQRLAKSQQVEGVGLGLAIVKEIAERHGGRVWAEPGEPSGTTFYVSISRALRASRQAST
jgi:signal transduction histidine kinase